VILCKICQTRRPRRYCPGVEGDICSLCCGTGREVTVSCPLDCEYLLEARIHDKPTALPTDYPNKDVRITDEFLSGNEGLLMILSISLAAAFVAKPEMIDLDVREALEALIRTYRTRESGLIYETKPANPLAAYLAEKLQRTATDYGKRLEGTEAAPLRDAVVLGVLVFLQRMEMHHNNGRGKGKAFISFLSGNFPVRKVEPAVEL
jgi:hypothetical protein